MKKVTTLFALCTATLSAFAQIGATAPDFTQSDINGTSHNLYTYLNAGKVVVVDMSATWCGPCWGFHEGHYLDSIYAQFGPSGTNKVVVLFYEDDVSTTLADLNGTGSSTVGDWVTGANYPIINGTSSLAYPEYGEGYPTVSVICPSDKKIKYNLFDYSTYSEMKTVIQNTINTCTLPSSIEELTGLDVSIGPNPTGDYATIRFAPTGIEDAIISVYSVSGQVLQTTTHKLISGANAIELNLSKYQPGTYFVKVNSGSKSSKIMPLVKQ